MSKYVYFDLDGTLTDPFEGISNCIAHALEHRTLGEQVAWHQEFGVVGDAFEEKLINQPSARKLEESMAIGWEILGLLAAGELTRLSNEQITHYVKRQKTGA